jgi:hypothetical protein
MGIEEQSPPYKSHHPSLYKLPLYGVLCNYCNYCSKIGGGMPRIPVSASFLANPILLCRKASSFADLPLRWAVLSAADMALAFPLYRLSRSSLRSGRLFGFPLTRCECSCTSLYAFKDEGIRSFPRGNPARDS